MAEDVAQTADFNPAELLEVLVAFRNGDFSVRMPCDSSGVAGKVADTLNEILETENTMLAELGEVARAVGREGIINQRISLPR